MWYNYNGEYLQFPDNGFFNILTGEFAAGPDVMEIYLKGKVPVEDKAYNYFEGKPLNYTEVNYIIQTTAQTNTYMFPDVYAMPSENINGAYLASGVIVPVSRVTADAANNIVGEWYYSSGQWLQTKDTKLYAGEEFNISNLKAITGNTCLMTRGYTSDKVSFYKNPANTKDIIYTLRTTNPYIRPLYYEYTDTINNKIYYFDGKGWFDKALTSNDTTAHNKNYTVSVASLPCYKYPWNHNKNQKFKEFDYYLGDRFTILYVSTYDSNWGYTGRGWVQIDGNLSEIM